MWVKKVFKNKYEHKNADQNSPLPCPNVSLKNMSHTSLF